jgi:hypothetical protein
MLHCSTVNQFSKIQPYELLNAMLVIPLGCTKDPLRWHKESLHTAIKESLIENKIIKTKKQNKMARFQTSVLLCFKFISCEVILDE